MCMVVNIVTEILLDASKEVNTEKNLSVHLCIVHQHAGQNRNIKITNIFYENVATNQN